MPLQEKAELQGCFEDYPEMGHCILFEYTDALKYLQNECKKQFWFKVTHKNCQFVNNSQNRQHKNISSIEIFFSRKTKSVIQRWNFIYE